MSGNQNRLILPDPGDLPDHMPIQFNSAGHTWRLAWVGTTCGFGQWYVAPAEGGDFFLWYPSMGHKCLHVKASEILNVTYIEDES